MTKFLMHLSRDFYNFSSKSRFSVRDSGIPASVVANFCLVFEDTYLSLVSARTGLTIEHVRYSEVFQNSPSQVSPATSSRLYKLEVVERRPRED